MKDVYIINSSEYNTIFPKLNEDVINNLEGDLADMYFILYSAYSYIFRKYIIDKLDLKIYDQELQDSGLAYVKISNEDMDLYQYLTKDELKYFYIRNNIYIERLTNEEREKLLTICQKDSIELDDDTKTFTENTYKKVIFDDILENGEVTRINYGPISDSYMAFNDSLIIGINYDEFNLNGMTDDEWNTNHDKQLNLLYGIMDKIEEESSMKLDIPTTCIKYDYDSIVKKNKWLDTVNSNTK